MKRRDPIKDLQHLRDITADYERSPQGVAHDLRLDLADIVYRQLAARKMTQRQLAKLAGLKPSYLSPIMHSSKNWTTKSAGKILAALGIRVELVEKPKPGTVPDDFNLG